MESCSSVGLELGSPSTASTSDGAGETICGRGVNRTRPAALTQLRRFSSVSSASPCWCHSFRRASPSCAAVGIAGLEVLSVLGLLGLFGLLKGENAFLLYGALEGERRRQQCFAGASESSWVHDRSPGRLQKLSMSEILRTSKLSSTINFKPLSNYAFIIGSRTSAILIDPR